MKNIQRPQASVKRKNVKKGKINSSSKKSKENFVESSVYNKNEEKMSEVSSIGIQVKKSKKDATNYSDLLQSLTKIQVGSEYRSQEMINVQMLPYKIPAVYSLDMEVGILCLMKERIDIISQNMCRTDIEAISLDWKKVGGDINNAICRCRGCYVEKNGRWK